MYIVELQAYNMGAISPDAKRDLDNLNRGRIDAYNLILGIGKSLEEMKVAEEKEANAPKDNNPGAY